MMRLMLEGTSKIFVFTRRRIGVVTAAFPNAIRLPHVPRALDFRILNLSNNPAKRSPHILRTRSLSDSILQCIAHLRSPTTLRLYQDKRYRRRRHLMLAWNCAGIPTLFYGTPEDGVILASWALGCFKVYVNTSARPASCSSSIFAF